MNAAKNPLIQMLFDASARDERTLRFELEDDEVFGFHVQQAVEKLLKAATFRQIPQGLKPRWAAGQMSGLKPGLT